MERDLGSVAVPCYRTEVCGVLNTVLMERDLGSVAGSMVTEQRFGAS